MVSHYHSKIEKGIRLAGEELIRQKKVKKIFKGNQKALSIIDSDSKSVVNYQPDVYFILRNNKKLIFEVLDSEEQKQDIIIADVIRSFLIENVNALIFVYSGDKDVEKRIMEALITISKGLISKGLPQEEIPFDKSGSLAITKQEAKSLENIKDKIISFISQKS